MRVLLVLVSVLALTTAASAECAWVLWVRAADNPPSGLPTWTLWKPTAGYARQPDCYVSAKREATRYHNPIYGEMLENLGMYSTMQGTAKERWQGTTQFMCFPDTVSPKE